MAKITLIKNSYHNLALSFDYHTKIVEEITAHIDAEDLCFTADPETRELSIELNYNPSPASVNAFQQLQNTNLLALSSTLKEITFLTEYKVDPTKEKFFVYFIGLLQKYKFPSEANTALRYCVKCGNESMKRELILAVLKGDIDYEIA